MVKKILIFVLLMIPFTGCIVKKDKGVPIKVAYWGSPEEIQIITETMRKWEKKNPGLHVKLQHSKGGRDYISKILTQMASGDAPDIIFAEVNVFVPMYEKDVFLDLSSFINEDKNFNINDFFQPVVQRFTRNNKIYCIPRDTAPFACVYYNKKLFDEAGIQYPSDNWDFNDLIRISKKLTKRNADGRILQYGFYSWAYMNFIYSYGGRLVDNIENPTKFIMNEKQALKGLQFYIDLCNKYKVSPTPIAIMNLDQGPLDMFMAGKLAMFNSGIWETPRMRTIKDFDWDIVMFPKGPVKQAFGTGGSGYCIAKTTKYPKEAWKVLKALAGDWGQEMLAKKGLAQPSNKKIANGKYWALSKEKPLNKKMLNKAVNYAVYEPFHPKWQEAQDKYLREALDKVFNNQITIEEFAKIVVPNVNKLMFDK